MKNLDNKLIKEFLKKASLQLSGKWILIGGTLLPAVGMNIRSTVDIDLIGLGVSEKSQNLELMSLAESLGLSVETINQAAEFYLSKIKYQQKDLIPLIQEKKCVIYRPSVELYFQLKVLRLSESDLLDCKFYFNYCKSISDTFDKVALKKTIQKELKSKASEEKVSRLQDLLQVVEE